MVNQSPESMVGWQAFLLILRLYFLQFIPFSMEKLR